MKTKIIIALVAVAALCTVLFFVLANPFSKPQPLPQKNFDITGSWKIDSFYNTKDSAHIGLFALALGKAIADSSGIVYKFNTDSTYQTLGTKENTPGYYVLDKDTLTIKADSSFEKLVVGIQNDSLITVTDKDNTVVVLHRLNDKQ